MASMRDAMKHKYPGVQFILDALAGSLVVLTAEGDLLIEDDHIESSKTGKWAMMSPTDSVLAQIHQAKVKESSMWKPAGKVEGWWF